jgi:RNA polymerase sigma-70 factor, ECF subfamily
VIESIATVQERPLAQTKLSDEVLVARLSARDMTAFALLYDRYAPAVYAMAAHLLNPREAEEIVQEVFLRLWLRADQFDAERGSFRGWFFAVARHQILDQLKRCSQEQRVLALYEIERLLTETNTDIVDQVAEMLWEEQRQQAMLQALHTLPAEQRRALVLAYFGGLSQSTIAQELGWPLGTVKKRIRLGIQKLREALVHWRQVHLDDSKS